MDTTYDDAPVETVSLPQGTIEYRDMGPDRDVGSESGEVLLFVHGLFANGGLWRNVAGPLSDEFRCLVPTLPLGGHTHPMAPEADLTPPGLAALLAGFVDALGVERVVLVGNDTGGAICQMFLAERPERVERLVLTNCDAFDNFPPLLGRPFTWGARVPGVTWAFAQSLRSGFVRRLAFRLLAKHPVEPDALASYVDPLVTDVSVRRDLREAILGVSPQYTNAAAETFPAFDHPVLIVWALDDPLFPLGDAERLAGLFPNARLERVEDSFAFVSEDQPERLVGLIGAFVDETRTDGRGWAVDDGPSMRAPTSQ